MDYERVADLPVTIESVSTTQLEADTTSDFTRVTTLFSLSGPGEVSGGNTGEDSTQRTGEGEDVTYETEEHHVLADAGLADLTGEYTIDSFSARLAETDLFPAGAPDREEFRNYRRWGLESAALDLALRQAETDIASALERSFDPVRFVTSTRLGEPPSTDRLEKLQERVPDVEFKLDPTPEWDDAIAEAVSATAPVRILDLKGQYEGTEVDVPADPALYRRVLEAFPDAVIEDPALTEETEEIFDDPDVRSRVSWDAPIHGLEDVEELPWEPGWLNIKPSRFGSLESLLETIAFCEDHEIRMYGGGQFELGVGRTQIQTLASLFYPETPNDVAPRAYNIPEVADDLPASPLEIPTESDGFGW